MDASSIEIIVDNTEAWLEDAYTRAFRVMRKAGVLPGMANDAEECSADMADVVGDAIMGLIIDYARRENRLIEDGEKTMTSAIFFTTLGHIDWRDIGRHYYIRTREKYEYDNIG